MDIETRKKIYRNSQLYRLNKVKLNDALTIKQYGGSKTLSVEYKNNKYIFNKSFVDDNHYILSSKDDDDCVSIIISNNGYAEIHGIGNYKGCLIDTNQNVGSNLLKLTIKMLKKYKDKLKIKMITLTDNSIKSCSKVDIKLAQMLTLLNGNTWYSNHGFKPIKTEDNSYIIDEYDNKKLDKNKEIMNKIKISDIDILKYIQLTNNDAIIKATKKILKQNPNMLLKVFLSNFLRDYDKTCIIFYTFYRQLFDDIGLTNFYKYPFGLIL